MGAGGYGDRPVQGVGEGDEALGDAAGLGERIELLFGGLDLVAGRAVGVALGRHIGDVAADTDQVAAQRQVVDRPGVVRGVGGGRRAVDEVGRMADAAQTSKPTSRANCSAIKIRLGELALADVALDGGEQPLVEGSKKWRACR